MVEPALGFTHEGAMTFADRMFRRMFATPSGLLGHLGGALMARGNEATERRAVELAAPCVGDRVVVVGCGPGVGVSAAAECGARVVALDPSEPMLRATLRRIKAHPGRQVLCGFGTAEETGAEDDSVDVIVSVNNIHLWSTVGRGLAEARRVLRADGQLVISSHVRALPLPARSLIGTVKEAGFTVRHAGEWDPPSIMAGRAFQMLADRR
ncbi:class I SAM-dependent methyltransferase [Ruania halotolerans]|uniref:class I SAM-dependent methyltransferase n=1 Tax=Ruania halotolerans TaxID=2897773 RepID=UPI001E3696F5|nr:class I SAM-dependent methyltransferase [Ruania halotolerans]UFU05331.1 class I SAM-dependent methyltransferase [Ruania halotolerans]